MGKWKAEEVLSNDLRSEWGDYLDRVRVGGERFTIRRYTKVVAALVTAEDARVLALLEKRDPKLARELRAEATQEK